MQNEPHLIGPNPPRVDERDALPLGSVRVGHLVNSGKFYAAYGVFVNGYRRYERFSWTPTQISTDSLLVWSENLSTDVYEAVLGFAQRQRGPLAT